MAQSSFRRLAFLDSLRGWAALYVVLFHVAVASEPRLPVATWLMPIAVFGVTGVHLFFVISGFSLSLTMPRHEASGATLLSYFSSRVFRIVPLFYFLLLFAIPRNYFAFNYIDSVSNFALNASFLFNLVPNHQEGIVWASWTVSVEVIYYLTFPFIHSLSNSIKLVILFGCAILYALTLQHPLFEGSFEYFFFLGYVPFFILGEITFSAYSFFSNRSDHHRIGQMLIVAGALILVADMMLVAQSSIILFRTMSDLGYMCLLLGLGLFPLRALINGFARFYGKISYSFYLCHMLIMFGLRPVYQFLGAKLPELAYFFSVSLTIAGTTLLALICHNLIEQPGVKFGKRVFQNLASGASAGAR